MAELGRQLTGHGNGGDGIAPWSRYAQDLRGLCRNYAYPASTSSTQTVVVNSKRWNLYQQHYTGGRRKRSNYTLSGHRWWIRTYCPTGTISFLDTSNSNALLRLANWEHPAMLCKVLCSIATTIHIAMTPTALRLLRMSMAMVFRCGLHELRANVVSVSIGKWGRNVQAAVSYAAGASPGFIAVGISTETASRSTVTTM